MNKQRGILEVCVDSVASAVAAEAGGADRLELCADLLVGGTTPTAALLEAVRKRVSIPIRAMVRPRFGDFCYSSEELEVMEAEVRALRALGADGVVFGVLTPEGDLDRAAMQRLRDAAGDMGCTLHRAFDVSRDAASCLEAAVAVGMDTVLTSGQKDSCTKGAALLKELHECAAGRIDILVGAGLKPEHIRPLAEETGCTSFHLSGKKRVPSAMVFRREGVPMGLPGISEYELELCDEETIRAARRELTEAL